MVHIWDDDGSSEAQRSLLKRLTGTPRSHKKLLAQDKGASEWRDRLAAKKQAEAEPAEAAKKQKRKRAAGATAEPPRRPPPAAAPPPARPAVLPNKGRWGSTLASQLIQ